jgi:hypothetical protein
MLHFCTLFDSFYLSRGLAMYESLKEQTTDFHIYIFAFDDLSYKLLLFLNLEHATIVPLSEFETNDLKQVKQNRSTAEYCWTSTPSTILFVLKKYNLPSCTYIDADLCFYADPSVLISEMEENGKNVLITEHRFSPLPKLLHQERAGRFCVQFITFSNEERSLMILDNWRKQCLQWCYSRYEDGKFGDQKYLDEWPSSYPNIHILQHEGGGVAPWNVTQYTFTKTGNTITGRKRNSGIPFNVVFFHFQYVKLIKDGSHDIGWYYITSNAKKMFYLPYLRKIEEIERKLNNLNTGYKTGYTDFKTHYLKSFFKSGMKKIFGYNIIKEYQNNGISY